jgi:hypothetical protein
MRDSLRLGAIGGCCVGWAMVRIPVLRFVLFYEGWPIGLLIEAMKNE